MPLLTVMCIFEFRRVGTFTWGFQLDKADESLLYGNRIVRASLQVRKWGFINRDYVSGGYADEVSEAGKELFKRGSQLIFRPTCRGRVCKFIFSFAAEFRDRFPNRQLHFAPAG